MNLNKKNDIFSKSKDLPILVSAIVFLCAIIFVLIYSGQKHQQNTQATNTEKAFAGITLEAKSAIVYDMRTGKVLFEKNDLVPRPLASITKLMTILAASQKLNNGDTVVINKKAIDTYGDSGLNLGERFTFKRLVAFTLVGSSNDGAQALASAADAKIPGVSSFSQDMNSLSKKIDLNSLLFENPTGLDSNTSSAGAYGTVLDIAKLLTYIVKTDPSLISATRYQSVTVKSENNMIHTIKNTDESIPFVPGLIGGKTGYTDLAGGNLAVAFDPGLNNPYAIVVLGSTEQGRFSDVQKLVAATIKATE